MTYFSDLTIRLNTLLKMCLDADMVLLPVQTLIMRSVGRWNTPLLLSGILRNLFLEGMSFCLKCIGLSLCGPHDKDINMCYMAPHVIVTTGDLDACPSIGSQTAQTKPYLFLGYSQILFQ